ncbi:putative small G protein [Trypanosoma vivax]|nr:putative small G protein [Trypanosoma vivax]
MSFLNTVKATFGYWQKPTLSDGVRVVQSEPSQPRGQVSRFSVASRPHIWPIHPEVQREIQAGAHLNMKAVVRGMRCTGKSTVVSRLCGHTVGYEYIPSCEMTAGTFFYRGRTSAVTTINCIGAKVELWDVADTSGSPSASAVGPAVSNAGVYCNCHLAAFVIDRTRRETFDYAMREVHHVPITTCILFILNFHDAPLETHVVSEEELDMVCRTVRRTTSPSFALACAGGVPPRSLSAPAMWVSISAATGYGVDLLRDAFEVPYLFLNVLTYESKLLVCFRAMDQHHSQLLSEQVRALQAEREKQRSYQCSEGCCTVSPANSCSLDGTSTMKEAPILNSAPDSFGGYFVQGEPMLCNGKKGNTREEKGNVADGFSDGSVATVSPTIENVHRNGGVNPLVKGLAGQLYSAVSEDVGNCTRIMGNNDRLLEPYHCTESVGTTNGTAPAPSDNLPFGEAHSDSLHDVRAVALGVDGAPILDAFSQVEGKEGQRTGEAILVHGDNV